MSVEWSPHPFRALLGKLDARVVSGASMPFGNRLVQQKQIVPWLGTRRSVANVSIQKVEIKTVRYAENPGYSGSAIW